MAYTNIFIGAQSDLKMYMGDDIIGFTFTVTNADTTAYDFTGYTDQYLKIYNHRGGTLEVTIAAADLTIASNVITWSSDYSATIALTDLDIYYYELTYEDATSRPITIAYGNLNLV